MLNPSRFLLMRGEHSALSSPRKKISPSHQQNSTILLPFQSKHINLLLEGQCFKILRYQLEKEHQKQEVLSRCNLQIQYIPQFEIIGQNKKFLTVKIKQYTDELLPWLITKDSLSKVTIILGIYISFLQLIDVYGLFPLSFEMMKVNKKQQVAIWFNSNFQLLHPVQITPKNNTSIHQFIQSFIKLFKCCLPNNWRFSQTQYTNQNELLVELTKLEKKQIIHKNCHEFIKHELGLKTERKTYNRQRLGTIESRQVVVTDQRNVPSFILKKNQLSLTDNNADGLRSQRKIKQVRFDEKVNQDNETVNQDDEKVNQDDEKVNQRMRRKKQRCKSCFQGYFMQKKSSIVSQTQQQIDTKSNKELTICSKGDLFKRYLLFNTLKNRRMNKLGTFNSESEFKAFPDKNRTIFRPQSYRVKRHSYSKAISVGNSPMITSQKLILSSQNEKYSPIKFRKFSSNTSEKIEKQQVFNNKQRMKPRYHHKRIKSQVTYKQNNEDIKRRQQKQKLQNSFPIMTASTLTSFRMSNQHQQLIASNKQEQSLTLNPLQCMAQPKQKGNKIQVMKIEQQNELQAEFNNIFSMQNSKVINDEHQKEMQRIITEFEQILF